MQRTRLAAFVHRAVWKNDAIENILWLELLRPFAAVENLYLSKEFAPGIAVALQELSGITEVLPRLQNIFVEGLERLGPLQENIGQFVATRRLSGHPIAVSIWTWDKSHKHRALLVGITYTSPSNTWAELNGPHEDVDRYRDLLISTYGYRPGDIVVLKDLPGFPEQSKPTRVNMIRDLKALVSGAEPGDTFTFFYSGHSDQQDARSDLGEEGGMDELIITSDEKIIVYHELKRILVDPLPVGCTLLAIIDASHSGTMLDLPHYDCNDVYVPWRQQPKGERRTMTIQNINVRRLATNFFDPTTISPPPTFETEIGAIEGQSPTAEPIQIGTQVGEADPADLRKKSSRGRPRARSEAREQILFGSQTRFASPEARFVCDGWCKHSDEPHPNVLSLSACSDLQRAWEGPKGSLTTVLCNYLKKNSHPSYRALMTHINFQLHDNALALHEYTRHKRKMHSGFDGEIHNFQTPELSSLVKLDMDDVLQL
ncbi:caspase domain-containing protein [Russula aff. rugulosa BPL654]|nr:caspase domain-containing protein [Russula aff. rugulosa BPL654]